jgi:LPS sulfotransferase NodH
MALGYQNRDYEIVDYEQYRLTPKFLARGPAPRSLEPGQYFACIGAAQTFGCFCESPYPALLHQQIGIEALNLGCAGAGPKYFLNEPRLLAFVNAAKFVIVQVMSGRSEDNSVFRSGGLEWLYRRSDGEGLSAEIAYKELLEQHDEAFVRRVLDETRANWVASFTSLLNAIQRPKILFWFSQRHPDYTERLDRGVHGMFGEFPQMVNAAMVEAIAPYADAYVECISSRGMPQLLKSRFTGKPAIVDYTRKGEEQYADSYNTYYPSPEMQVDAADALHDVCLEVSAAEWAHKPGTKHRDTGRVSATPEQVLEPLKQTLLARLIGIAPLAFIGDRRTIDYLRAFFAAADVPSDHRYICAEEQPATDWAAIIEDRRAIVASLTDEDAVFEDVTRRIQELGSATPLLRLFADVFVNIACDAHPLDVVPEPATPAAIRYAIVGTPRCGSEFLCHALSSTNAAGFPEEHLRLETQLLTRYARFDCARYFRILMSRRTTSNGAFGTKIISHFLHDHLSRVPALKDELRRFTFVHVIRRDRVRQAISALLASKTGIWHVRNEKEQANYRRLLANVTIDDSDLQWVKWLSGGFERENRQLHELLTKRKWPAITVYYEDLVSRPAEQLRSILTFLEIDADPAKISVGLKPTRSDFSDDVHRMYLESPYAHKRKMGGVLRFLMRKVGKRRNEAPRATPASGR